MFPGPLEQLAAWIQQQPGIVIVDAGTGPPPKQLTDIADRNVLVTRADYLALKAANRSGLQPDDVVVVNEAHRTLTVNDISTSIGTG